MGIQRGPVQRAVALVEVPLENAVAVDYVHAPGRCQFLQPVVGPGRPLKAAAGFVPGFPGIDCLAVGIEDENDVVRRQAERRGQLLGELRQQRLVGL